MKFLKLLLVVFSIIVIHSNLSGQVHVEASTDTSSVKEADSPGELSTVSDSTASLDKAHVFKYYRTLSIGFAGEVNKDEPDYGTETGTIAGSYLKIAAMFH
nr:hypothetical protein [Candidatus Kapabacteria bacterium]